MSQPKKGDKVTHKITGIVGEIVKLDATVYHPSHDPNDPWIIIKHENGQDAAVKSVLSYNWNL